MEKIEIKGIPNSLARLIGFELGGGTVATGLELDTVITVVGFTVDKEISGGFPYSSYGSVLSFDSAAGNYTIATANIPADSAGFDPPPRCEASCPRSRW